MGLINDVPQEAPDVPEPTAPPATGAPPQGGQQSPDSQRILIAATKIIHDPAQSQKFVQLMQRAGDPATGIAEATRALVGGMFEKSRQQMPLLALIPALPQIIAMFGELAHAAGIFEVTPEIAKQAAEIIKSAIQKNMPQQGAPGQDAATPPPPAGAPPAGSMPPQPMGA